MAGKKIQLPAVGGIRKVIQTGGPTVTPGTTIQEFGSAVVTLAQLKAALGITTATAGSSGSSASSLVPGPGLTGGGPIIGAVPLRLLQLTPPVVWNEPLLPDDWIGSGGSTVSSGGGGSSGVTVTDGTHTVAGATQVTFSGATVSGTTPNATVTVSGGGGSIWSNIVNQPFSSNTTGFASNGSGTWGIVGGVLNQSVSTTSAGPCFIYQTAVPFVAMRLQADVELVSAGAASTQVTGFCLSTSASPGANPTGNIVDEAMRYVSGVPNYSSDFYGNSTIATFAYNWGARDVFHHLELIILSMTRIIYIDGVVVGSWTASGSYAQFQFPGLFAYGGAANFKNFTVDVLTP
jgi:hypothetical protein